jgi:hypothetical protein
MSIPSRRLASAGFVLAGALLLPACSPASPLIPADVVEMVAEEGRMHSYDVAWQNTRMLNDAIARDDGVAIAEQIVVLTARLHRLETASASSMADRKTAQTLENLLEQARGRSAEENTEAMAMSALALQDAFDVGNFALAKQHALEVFALVLHGR